MREGGWVFISHSHRDIDSVRIIRNELEKLGFEPLMFYLRCLSDEEEIEGLIKREISEREWFIYADSKNARASRWVQTEREYIESFENKHIFTVDLEADLNEQLQRISYITRQMKVFLAHSAIDYEAAFRLKERLIKKDVLVYSNEDYTPGKSWQKTAKKNIGDASRDGFVIFIITQRSILSQNMLYEVMLARHAGGKIIPVFVGDVTPEGKLAEYLSDTTPIRVSEKPTDEELDGIVSIVLKR